MSYIAISEKLGVYLADVLGCAIFSRTDTIGLYFTQTAKDKEFFIKYFGDLKPDDLFFVCFDDKPPGSKITVMDLVKAGYGDYAHNMLAYTPCANKRQI